MLQKGLYDRASRREMGVTLCAINFSHTFQALACGIRDFFRNVATEAKLGDSKEVNTAAGRRARGVETVNPAEKATLLATRIARTRHCGTKRMERHESQ